MDAAKKKTLKAAGWRFGDAADFLEMAAEELQLLGSGSWPVWSPYEAYEAAAILERMLSQEKSGS